MGSSNVTSGIENFDILLDISDRERLYDYVRREEVRRPETGGWDWEALRKRGEICEKLAKNSCEEIRIRLMDNSWADKRFFEKKVEEQTGKERSVDDIVFKSAFDTDSTERFPRRLLPIYLPGDIVKGTVFLELSDILEADKVEVNLLGHAKTKIRVHHGKGYYDDVGSEKYVDENEVLWKSINGSKTGSGDVIDSLDLISECKRQSQRLTPGKFLFNFEFALPKDVRHSTPPLIKGNIWGPNEAFIVYRLKATVNKGKVLCRGNDVTHRGIWVEQPCDIARMSDRLRPVTAEHILNTWISCDKIKCRVSLPRSAFLRGEDIPLTIDVENESKSPIDYVEAKVTLSGRARAGTGLLRAFQNFAISTKEIRSEAIESRMYPRLTWQLPVDFSDTYIDNNVIPVGTLEDCTLIDVKYDVIVKLRRRGFRRNVVVNIPIVLGNEISDEKKGIVQKVLSNYGQNLSFGSKDCLLGTKDKSTLFPNTAQLRKS